MKKIKGLKKLNQAVSAQLKPFGIASAFCRQMYAYHYATERVEFTLQVTMADEWFNKFIEERFNYKVEYPFIIALLHEVGHHKANDEIDGAIADFCELEKERITKAMLQAEDDEEKQKIFEWQYFNLPDEIMATQWAINYAKKHPKKIVKMWKAIEPVIINLYRKNLDHEIFEELNK